MTYKQQQAGFSLIEVLVAITVLLIATVGPMTIAAQALKSAQYSREQNTAFFLAQEGIEAVVLFRNEAALVHLDDPSNSSRAWQSDPQITLCASGEGCGFHFTLSGVTNNSPIDCSGSNSPCRLYFDENDPRARYSHNRNGGEPTPFTRQVFVQPLGSGERMRVTSIVNWQPAGNLPPQTVRLQTFIHDIYNTN